MSEIRLLWREFLRHGMRMQQLCPGLINKYPCPRTTILRLGSVIEPIMPAQTLFRLLYFGAIRTLSLRPLKVLRSTFRLFGDGSVYPTFASWSKECWAPDPTAAPRRVDLLSSNQCFPESLLCARVRLPPASPHGSPLLDCRLNS